MNESEMDAEKIIQDLILSLSTRPSADENAQIALEILRQCRPEVSVKLPSIRETDESGRKLLSVWNQIVLPVIAKHAQPIGLRHGILFVAVDSSAWLSEIVRYHRKSLLGKLKEALPGIVKQLSFRHELPAEFHVTFTLPLPLWKRSVAVLEGSGNEEEHLQTTAQQCIKDALHALLPGFDVEVSFDPMPLPAPAPVRIPREQHFMVCEAVDTLERHYLGQLHLDLFSAIAEAKRLMANEHLDPLAAFQQGISRVAGQRWARYKSAQESADEKAMKEMHAFGTYWYALAGEVRGLAAAAEGEAFPEPAESSNCR